MAKYVGKIFRVNNTALNIKRRGTHYVHVTWYNPFTRKFRCKVITSLEDKKVLSEDEKRVLSSTPYHKEKDNTYNLFSKRKYSKLRNGDIQPISAQKTKGFEVWSGYSGSRDLFVSVLKGNEQKHLKIEK
ncbi:MAG: hypothetical protein IJZ32_03195 [Clostridia bacterium]|nr:hypothetical protein [Clostridia bacterium]